MSCATAGDQPDGGSGGPADAADAPDAAKPAIDATPGKADGAPADAAAGPDAVVTPIDAAVPPADAPPTPDAGPGDCVVGGVLTFTNSTAAAINDVATTTSTVTVTGADPSLALVSVITNITHTYADDLDITLVSPAGTRVTLTTDNGDGNDNVFAGTQWADGVNQPASDHAYVDGVTAITLTPEGSMLGLAGQNPNGTWTLEVVDDSSLDTGTLVSWTLEVAALPAAPTYTPTTVSRTPGIAIPDVATVTDSAVVAAGPTEICRVELTTGITHTYSGDLSVVLVSPAGTRVAVTTGNGASNDDVFDGTLWRDAAEAPATDFVYTTGVTATPLTAESALSVFNGEDANGTWTLEVADTAALDTGALASWSLTASSCVCP